MTKFAPSTKAFVKYRDNSGDVRFVVLSDFDLTEEGGVVGSNFLDDYDIPPESVIEIDLV